MNNNFLCGGMIIMARSRRLQENNAIIMTLTDNFYDALSTISCLNIMIWPPEVCGVGLLLFFPYLQRIHRGSAIFARHSIWAA